MLRTGVRNDSYILVTIVHGAVVRGCWAQGKREGAGVSGWGCIVSMHVDAHGMSLAPESPLFRTIAVFTICRSEDGYVGMGRGAVGRRTST